MNSSRRLTPAERLHGEQPPPPAVLRAGLAYTRFIPREELQGFAAWTPGAFAERPSLVQPPQPGAPHAAVRARAQGEAAPSARAPAWPVGDLFSDAPSAPQPAAVAAPAPAPAPEMAQDMAAALAAQRAELLADLQQQLAAARQQGYQDGYRDGLQALEGFKQSFAAQATSQVGALVQGIDRAFDALEAQMSQAVAATALRLARQVLRAELLAQPERVAAVAAEAIDAVLLSARQITLHVHPQDLPLVAEGAEESLQARGARLQADDTVERGGVMVVSDVGSIDARIATRWAQAVAALGADEPLVEPPAA
jgi:flagellar assembly protein FliH